MFTLRESKSKSVRGAVNVEYLLLMLIVAVSLTMGVLFLGTSINNKHAQVASALSNHPNTLAAAKALKLGIQSGYMGDAITGHPKDGLVYVLAYKDALAMSDGGLDVATVGSVDELIAAPAPAGQYELQSSDDGQSNWSVVATSTTAIFADLEPAKSSLYYKIVETQKNVETPATLMNTFWHSPVVQAYVGDKVALTIPHVPAAGVAGTVVDNYGNVVANATVTETSPTVTFTPVAGRTYTFQTTAGAQTQPTAPVSTMAHAPLTGTRNADGTWDFTSTGVGDPRYTLFVDGALFSGNAGTPAFNNQPLTGGMHTVYMTDVHGAQSETITLYVSVNQATLNYSRLPGGKIRFTSTLSGKAPYYLLVNGNPVDVSNTYASFDYLPAQSGDTYAIADSVPSTTTSVIVRGYWKTHVTVTNNNDGAWDVAGLNSYGTPAYSLVDASNGDVLVSQASQRFNNVVFPAGAHTYYIRDYLGACSQEFTVDTGIAGATLSWTRNSNNGHIVISTTSAGGNAPYYLYDNTGSLVATSTTKSFDLVPANPTNIYYMTDSTPSSSQALVVTGNWNATLNYTLAIDSGAMFVTMDGTGTAPYYIYEDGLYKGMLFGDNDWVITVNQGTHTYSIRDLYGAESQILSIPVTTTVTATMSNTDGSWLVSAPGLGTEPYVLYLDGSPSGAVNTAAGNFSPTYKLTADQLTGGTHTAWIQDAAGIRSYTNTFTVPNHGHFVVTATNNIGKPIMGATVTIGTNSATTDASGTATFYATAGSKSLSITKAGYTTYSNTVTMPSQTAPATVNTPVTMVGAQKATLTLKSGAALLPNTTVNVYNIAASPFALVATGTSNGSGVLTVNSLPPGSYVVLYNGNYRPFTISAGTNLTQTLTW